MLGISLTAHQVIAANSQSQIVKTTVNGPFEYNKEVNITTTIKGQSGLQQNIDVEIFDKNGWRIAQKVFSSNLAVNEQKDYSFNWVASDTGTFTVKVGIFNNDWSNLNEWNDNATTFQVTNGNVPPKPPFSLQFNSAYISSIPHEFPTKGDTMYIGAQVFNTGGDGSATIDIELYKDGKLINQKVFENVELQAGLVKGFTMEWIADAPGKYTVSVGLFKPNWELISWHDQATKFTVSETPQTSTYYHVLSQTGSIDPQWQDWSWDTDVVKGSSEIEANFKSPWAAYYLHTDSFDTTPYNVINVTVFQEGWDFDGMQLIVFGENGQVLGKKDLFNAYNNPILLSEVNADHRKITGIAIQGNTGKITKQTYISSIYFENRPGVE